MLQHIGWLTKDNKAQFYLWFHKSTKEFRISPIHLASDFYGLPKEIEIKNDTLIEWNGEQYKINLKK